jgi:hypothetical protein
VGLRGTFVRSRTRELKLIGMVRRLFPFGEHKR